jgi:hypothetical protein
MVAHRRIHTCLYITGIALIFYKWREDNQYWLPEVCSVSDGLMQVE